MVECDVDGWIYKRSYIFKGHTKKIGDFRDSIADFSLVNLLLEPCWNLQFKKNFVHLKNQFK